MYCYYPLDKEFPGRISEVMKDEDVSFAWDYPYDDYFTYKGGLEGNTEGEPFYLHERCKTSWTGRYTHTHS